MWDFFLKLGQKIRKNLTRAIGKNNQQIRKINKEEKIERNEKTLYI
jgi:hypothetical protein